MAEDQRAELTARSNGAGLMHLAAYFVALSLTTTWIVSSAPLWQLAFVAQGILLVFLFTLLHETSHNTAFRWPWLNKAVGIMCGCVVMIPPLWFRYFHLAHHKYTQDPDNDPELEEPKPRNLTEYLTYLSGARYWIGAAKTLIRNARGRADGPYLPKARKGAIVTEARLMLALYAGLVILSLSVSCAELLWLWIGPMLVGQPFLRLFLLAEHGACPQVGNMFENTRTTFTTRIVRAVSWNMSYHAEHHAYPNVPFHKLPRLHQIAKSHLRQTEEGYAKFGRIYLTMRRH